jgi:hypothetical protein
MLSGYLGIGFLAGSFLFGAKLVIFMMVMSLFPKGFKDWMHHTPFALILVDFGFAGLAAPIAGMAGGTIAMLTMISFGAWSAAYIVFRLALYKSQRALSRIKIPSFKRTAIPHNSRYNTSPRDRYIDYNKYA